LSVEEKCHENLSIKRKLGEAVVGLFDDKTRSVLLDSGTTTEEVARNIGNRPGLTVMTNGLNIAKVLASVGGMDIMVTGGTLRPTSMSFYGRQAEDSLRFMHFDCLVLGVDGFDPAVGITTHFEPESILNRMMCSVADRIIAVTDSSKFGKRGPHIICRYMDIDTLVTDSNAPKETVDALRRDGIGVHQVAI
jgi:DeoR family transcriptional regulator of aga operon